MAVFTHVPDIQERSHHFERSRHQPKWSFDTPGSYDLQLSPFGGQNAGGFDTRSAIRQEASKTMPTLCKRLCVSTTYPRRARADVPASVFAQARLTGGRYTERPQSLFDVPSNARFDPWQLQRADALAEIDRADTRSATSATSSARRYRLVWEVPFASMLACVTITPFRMPDLHRNGLNAAVPVSPLLQIIVSGRLGDGSSQRERVEGRLGLDFSTRCTGSPS